MYHYTESGLDNVWLQNGYVVRKTAYGKGVSVTDVDGLNNCLALRLAEKPSKLSGKELRFLRSWLDLSQVALGKMVGVTDQAVSLWERTGKVPLVGDRWIRLLVQGKLDGSQSVSDFLDRVTGVERMVHQRIVAKEMAGKRWRATVEEEGSV